MNCINTNHELRLCVDTEKEMSDPASRVIQDQDGRSFLMPGVFDEVMWTAT